MYLSIVCLSSQCASLAYSEYLLSKIQVGIQKNLNIIHFSSIYLTIAGINSLNSYKSNTRSLKSFSAIHSGAIFDTRTCFIG